MIAKGPIDKQDEVEAVQAAVATFGGEDPATLGALAGFDLTLGENAVAGTFEPDSDTGRRRGMAERRRREGLSMLGVESG